MTGDFEIQVTELRKKREEIINGILSSQKTPPVTFEYFPISENWRIKTEVKIRKTKPGPIDFNIKYVKIGAAKTDIRGQPNRFSLYQVENDPDSLFIFIKDGTSGKSTYGLGRFATVIKEGEEYFIDFNAAFTPACGYIEGAGCPFTTEKTNIPIEAGAKSPSDH
ncbi:MAG: DUF1684 domain-containing protein [Candidatus Hodarchaeales archaeon]|jgi:uncharacterized protein (DUF1684 family)